MAAVIAPPPLAAATPDAALAEQPAPRRQPRLRKAAVLLLLALAALGVLLGDSLPGLARFPAAWVLPAGDLLGRLLAFVAQDLQIGDWALGDLTRALASGLSVPVEALTGWVTEGIYLPWFGGAELQVPALPWFIVAAELVLLAFLAGGTGPAVMTGLTLVYVLACGLWNSSMVSLVSVLFAVLMAGVIGLALGVLAYRKRWARALLEPLHDALQTVPIFAYLSVILLFFGFGPIAALVATVIFAMPPMARATEMALAQVSPSLRDLATVTGCTPRQRLWWVELPAGRQQIMLGLNQMVMMSLAMVIVASIIGAGGLGSDVLRALKAMRITDAALAGLAITLFAVALDRVSIGWSTRGQRARHGRLLRWTPLGLLILGVLLAGLAPDFGRLPEEAPLQLGRLLDQGLQQFDAAARPVLVSVRDLLIVGLLRPVREALGALPWLPATLAIGALGLSLGGRRVGLLCIGLLTAMAALGLWERAVLSLYLVLVSIVAAFAIGFPLGLWAGLNARVNQVALIVTDTVQTLPTFVYLIPVVMLFGVGDFPAFLAIVIYAVAPIVRYTAAGLRMVPGALSEAALMCGCTPWQRLTKVLLPVATPQIVLGLNQAVMLSFSMLVITALVGSRGLEEATLVAVSRVKPGDGLVAGFGIAVLAIVVDRLLRAASARLAERYAGASPSS